MLPKLASCPLCGRSARLRKEPSLDGRRAFLYAASCGACFLTMYRWLPRDDAIRAWNRRYYVGSTARMITTMIERVVAGDDPKATVADYGPWEWGHGPDLGPLARLVELRDAVNAFATLCPTAHEAWAKWTEWSKVAKALKRAGGGRRRT